MRASIVLTHGQIRRFAEVSGDVNPLHVDEVYARATPFGQPVAHGVLAVLACLGAAPERPGRLTGLEVAFRAPVYPGVTYVLDVTEEDKGLGLVLRDGLRTVLEIDTRYCPGASGTVTGAAETSAGERRTVGADPDSIQVGAISTGRYGCDPDDVAHLVQQWALGDRGLTAAHVHALAWCSYTVGMELPGTPALLSRFSVTFSEADLSAPGPLRTRTEVTGRHADGGVVDWRGTVAPVGTAADWAAFDVRAWVRRPVPATTVEEVARMLAPSERWRDRVAVVIGGSRGLGAATAMALVGQGCTTYVVHHRSTEAAQRLRSDLGAAGERVILVQGDCAEPAFCRSLAERVRAEQGRLDALVLCAAPALLEQDADADEGRRLLGHVGEALAMVHAPLVALVPLLDESAGVAVGVSSSAATSPVDGWTHYVTAKNAVEGLVRATAAQLDQACALVVRPPRLHTTLTQLALPHAVLRPAVVATSIVSWLLDERTGKDAVTVMQEFDVRAGTTDRIAEAPAAPAAPATDSGGPRTAGVVQIVATFTADPVLPALAWWMDRLELGLEPRLSPYGQVLQELLDPDSAMSCNRDGVNVVLVRLSDWAGGDLASLVDDLVAAAHASVRASTAPLVVVTCPSPAGPGTVDTTAHEAALRAALEPIPGVLVLAPDHFGPTYLTPTHHDPERDRLGHIPYDHDGFAGLATVVARGVRAVRRAPAKVLVLDADNTLWRGLCGEDGPDGVVVDGPHRGVQEWALALRDRGVLLCLASKNIEADVRAALAREHMVLTGEHFAAVRINWEPKSENIRTMLADLGLGLDSVVFVDDNPAEVAEVTSRLPEVMGVLLPQDEDGVRRVVEHLWAFDQTQVTEEDRRRADRYQETRAREEFRAGALDHAAFVRGLGTRVEVRRARTDDHPRAAQMTQRTTQFNATGIQLDHAQVAVLGDRGASCWIGEVADRFGDHGVSCLAITSRREDTLVVENLLLSCRVLGKGVEHEFLRQLARTALADGARTVEMPMVPTARNEPVRVFLASVAGDGRETTRDDGATVVVRTMAASAAAEVAFVPRSATGTTANHPPAPATTGRGSRFLGLAGIHEDLASPVQVRRAVEGDTASPDAVASDAAPAAADGGLDDTRAVVAAFACVLRRPPAQLDGRTRLEDLGLSSMLMVEVTVELERHFGRLPATLLFENDTLEDVVQAVGRSAGSAAVREPEPVTARDRSAPRPTAEVRVDSPEPGPREAIAVVGLAGRYPGARDVGDLWEVLSNGTTQVREVPPSRWDHARYVTGDPAQGTGSTYSRWGCFVEGVAEFDSLYFKISPREAAAMDPQQRLFLQAAAEAVQDAGYTPAGLGQQVGVYVGAMAQDYGVLTAQAALEGTSNLPHAASYQIANRVSYCLDFRGPSITVDTACSSSGVALHLACQDLRSGRVEAAVAGGVNLLLHPARYIQYAQMGMLSRTGACRAFGADADGMIMGEGLGAVLLKTVTAAERDGDHIYGVIRGTAVNTAGHTQGFTVPSPTMQAALVRAALDDAGLPPERVSLIEAHGTGTPLGDPIEIRGLTEVFGPRSADRGPCAVTSAKSVIGHLEPAAAIAGLTKVLLQLRHRTVLPSWGAAELNPKIDFDSTCFVVPTSATAWEDGGTTRVAGVSSFGAGGVNAHLVVEEYRAAGRAPAPEPTSDELIVLSARSHDHLVESAARLRAWLVDQGSAPALGDLAYTLRTGRETWEHRAAFVVTDHDDLLRALEEFVRGGGTEAVEAVPCHGGVGSEAAEQSGMAQVLGTAVGADLVRALGRGGDLGSLGALWAGGAEIDWSVAMPRAGASRLSLPTYPFARREHWLALSSPAPRPVVRDLTPAPRTDLLGTGADTAAPVADPVEPGLLSFTGAEVWLRDHVIEGRRTLPGVLYLDLMLRAAGGGTTGTDGGRSVRDVVWAEALTVDGPPLEVLCRVTPRDAGSRVVSFHRPDLSGPGAVRGVVDRDAGPAPSPLVALPDDEGGVRQGPDQAYEVLTARRMAYGPAMQGLRSLRRLAHGVEAEVGVPADAGWSDEKHVVHPAVLDAALQSVVAGSGRPEAYLPYSLDTCWVGERGVHGDARVSVVYGRCDATMLRCDVDVTAPDGTLLAALRDLVLLPAPGSGVGPVVNALTPVWRQASAPAEVDPSQPVTPSHVVVVSDDPAHRQAWDREQSSGAFRVAAPWELARLLDDESAAVLVVDYRPVCGPPGTAADRLSAVHAISTAVLRGRGTATHLVLTRPAAQDPEAVASAAFGLAVAHESARFRSVRMEIGEGAPVPPVRPLLAEWGHADAEVAVDPTGAGRRVRGFERKALRETVDPVRRGGHYLISGGAGGVGLRVGSWLATTYDARVLLLGRSPREPWLSGQAPDAGAGRIEYAACDVTDRAAVEAVLDAARSGAGPFHGVIHAAGVIDDAPLLRKTVPQCLAVLAPKIAGIRTLDEATAADPLDLVVLMSSTAGTLGSAGQADYSMANRFLDAFAEYRDLRSREGTRRGRTVSIAWPLWHDGGMTVEPAVGRALQETTGFQPIGSTDALAFLVRALVADEPVVIAAHGHDDRIDRALQRRPAPRPTRAGTGGSATRGVDADLRGRVVQALREVAVALLQIDDSDLDDGVDFSEVGFDSVLYAEYAGALVERLGIHVSPVVFFDHQSIGALADHLVATYPSLDDDAPAVAPGPTAAPDTAAEDDAVVDGGSDRSERAATCAVDGRGLADRIAVVGMAGRFPGADDLDTFWANLAAGRNAVTEVPADRWDLHRYLPSFPGEPGTTRCRWGGFLSDVDGFDAAFFQITGKEARLMDPQQRLFLEAAWSALEDSGRDPRGLAGSRTGVFAGVSLHDHLHRLQESGVAPSGHLATGNVHSLVPNRVSHLLDLRGPSEAIDTACSSSLVALHRAATALRNGECELALVGGVNALLSPLWFSSFDHAGMLSERGRCATFDVGADGYVRGEGVGVVVLRRLEDAVADGDVIHGVITGSAVGHGGRAHSLTAPRPAAQADVVAAAHRQAGDLVPLSYVEAHGTGTPLGDPIEVEGLRLALTGQVGAGIRTTEQVHLGALKSVIGHLESASGVAGLIKVLLAMRHRTLPANLHFTEPNPHLPLDGSPLRVLDRPRPWMPQDEDGRPVPRKAGLSSFGFGGVNAHVVIEEPPQPPPPPVLGVPGGQDEAVILSAASAPQLLEYAGRMAHALRAGQELLDPAAVAMTLRDGRPALDHRLAVVGLTTADLAAGLESVAAGVEHPRAVVGCASAGGVVPDADTGTLEGQALRWVHGDPCRPGGDHGRGHRVALPTYPFARTAHAVATPFGVEPASSVAVAPTHRSRPAALVTDQAPQTRGRAVLLRPGWGSAGTAEPRQRGTGTPTVALLVAGRLGLDIAATVGGIPEARWVVIRDDSGMPRLSQHEYHLAEEDDSASATLAEAVRAHGVDAIVDLTGLERPTRTDRDRSASRLLDLVRTCLDVDRDRDLRVLHVGFGLSVEPERARVAAAVRALGAEYRRVSSGSVETTSVPDDPAQLIGAVLSELSALDPDRPAWLRLHEQEREARVWEEVTVPQHVPGPSRFGPFPVAPDGVYVVTGGTSGLGLAVAERLVERGARRLALLGLRDMPAADLWSTLASDHPRAESVRVLRRLLEQGVDLQVHTGPLDDRRAVDGFLARARSGGARITGVVHCAGTVPRSARTFVAQTPEEVEESWRAKNGGWHVVADLLAQDLPDFVVLFSSVAASVPVLGSGWAAYAGSNAFLDAEAVGSTRWGRGIVRAIGWGSWSGTGVGTVPTPAYEAVGLRTLSPADGLDLLESALMTGEPHLLAAQAGPDFAAETLAGHRVPGPAVGRDTDSSAAGRDTVSTDGPAGTGVVAPPGRDAGSVESFLLDLFEGELLVSRESMAQGATFAQLGIDSIFIAGLVPRLEAFVGGPVAPTLVVQHDTVRALASALSATSGALGTTRVTTTTPPAVAPAGQPSDLQPEGSGSIAVIGMAGRYPGAEDLAAFWRLLAAGESGVTEVPQARWDVDALYRSSWQPGSVISRWGGFLKGVDRFDPEHFQVDPAHAAYLHPVTRLFLEVGESAFCAAGFAPEDLRGRRVGVYVGGGTEAYGQGLREPEAASVTGLNQNFLAAQLAQYLDLRGPHLVVDTACSSSLTALHLGMQALRAGDCEMCLVGGADLILDATPYLKLSAARALSPDGQCRTFDARANGIVLGEGVGAVLLKPLAAAQRDGDRVLAVIEGSAVNNDGQTMGITTPNPQAQQDVVTRALRDAGVSAASIGYVEAHGTGTLIGDPIELQALASVFHPATTERGFCGIGSVKSNIGHLLRASGMAALHKVVLALDHEELPPTLHCTQPNPRFDFGSSAFVPVTALTPWRPRDGVRRAGISAFGFGGTNAHVVVRGLTEQERDQWVPTRRPIAPPQLHRRRFWLTEPESAVQGGRPERPRALLALHEDDRAEEALR